MKIVEKTENQIAFTADIDESLANAIRRYVSEVPTLAIDEVEIFKNDSPLYDETIAHRMGLIPLKMEKGITDKSQITLKLVASDEGFVYSGKLEGNAKIVYEKIPITSLNKGQELEIVATAKLGKGNEHSKFSPGLMFYRHVLEITLDKSLSEKVKRLCPNAEIKEKGDKLIIIDDKRKDIADICEGIAEKAKKKAETKPTGDLLITVESFGQMDPEEIFKKSIDVLRKDLAEIEKKISK
ncbi:MAG TPA: DNA-directed RNA polymerase subunit D [Patescibacteria group bacterium]|nr:DNA-directed RNA polymerase subunit D [Patescibacteria group bacterium]